MESMWKDLPPEVFEMVLACLPVQVLCRFRLICKRWNHLITQPRFVGLIAQAPRPQAFYVLITPRRVDYSASMGRIDWKVLDMAEKRFYTLSDSFTDRCRYNKNLGYVGYSKYTLAADGGLIYAMYFDCGKLKQHFDIGRPRQHIVCNLVSKSFHHIPEPGFHLSYDDGNVVVMSVDNATQSYRIITIETYTRSRREEVYLYDSTTAKWRKLCNVPGDEYFAYSCIFLKGVFYAVFVDTALVPWCPRLYSCDLETGRWRYIDVDLPQPSHPQEKAQLVVSLGRLFYVEYTELPRYPFDDDYMTTWEKKAREKLQMDVRIWEILLGEEQLVKVAEMPNFSKYPTGMMDEKYFGTVAGGNTVVALGCGNSVVISSLLGRCVEFDLLKKCWHELPTNSEHRNGSCRQGIYGALVHLDLRTMST